MAKYEVKFSCGHIETIELCGKVSERESKIKYYEEHGICSECYKAQRQAKEKTYTDKYDEVEMSYAAYKRNYSNCKTKADSYNAKTKTIIVYVPKYLNGCYAGKTITNIENGNKMRVDEFYKLDSVGYYKVYDFSSESYFDVLASDFNFDAETLAVLEIA